MKIKSFSIICIFLLILLIFTNSVFGVDNTINFTHNEQTISLPYIDGKDLSYGYFINYWGGRYYLVFMKSSGYLYINNNTISSTCEMDEYEYRDGAWRFIKTYSANTNNGAGPQDFVYASVNVYSDVNKSDVFFQYPPQTLSQIMEVEAENKATVQEILGVLPPILVVVVSFLGLRKALKMLLTLLRRCLSL